MSMALCKLVCSEVRRSGQFLSCPSDRHYWTATTSRPTPCSCNVLWNGCYHILPQFIICKQPLKSEHLHNRESFSDPDARVATYTMTLLAVFLIVVELLSTMTGHYLPTSKQETSPWCSGFIAPSCVGSSELWLPHCCALHCCDKSNVFIEN